MANEETDNESSWSRVMGLYVGALVALVVASGVLMQLLPTQEALIVMQVGAVLGAALAYSFIMGERRASWPSLDRVGLGPGQFVSMAFAAVTLGLAANATMGLTVELFPGFEPMAKRYRQGLNELVLKAEGMDRILGVFAICVAAPICEESLFRGTLLQEKRRLLTTGPALAANGLMFGLFHLNPIGLLPLAIVGAFLAHLIVMTESLWAAVLGHAIFNAFNGVVLPELMPTIETTDVEPVELLGGDLVLGAVPQFLLAIALFGGLGGVSWWWLARTARAERRASGAGSCNRGGDDCNVR